MLVAKLKNQFKTQVELSPNKFEERVGDAIHTKVYGYQLGMKNFRIRVDIVKEKIVPLNPSSDVDGEGLSIKEYETIKIYHINLNEQDLSRWGNNDSDLLIIAAEKIGLEIDRIVDVEEENNIVELQYKQLKN